MKRRGFSLVEIIIASIISVLLIVPLMALYQQSLNETQQSFDEIQATLYARELIEEIHFLKHVIGFDAITSLGDPSDKDSFVDLSNVEPTQSLFREGISDNTYKTTPFTTLNLSAIPHNYQRLIRLYPMNAGATFYQAHPQLLSLEATIRWSVGKSGDFNRKVTLKSLIARDEVKPEM